MKLDPLSLTYYYYREQTPKSDDPGVSVLDALSGVGHQAGEKQLQIEYYEDTSESVEFF